MTCEMRSRASLAVDEGWGREDLSAQVEVWRDEGSGELRIVASDGKELTIDSGCVRKMVINRDTATSLVTLEISVSEDLRGASGTAVLFLSGLTQAEASGALHSVVNLNPAPNPSPSPSSNPNPNPDPDSSPTPASAPPQPSPLFPLPEC